MRYRIEYADGRCCNFANSRQDLMDWLKLVKDEEITAIRKIYKNGVTDSVFDKYRNYVNSNANQGRITIIIWNARILQSKYQKSGSPERKNFAVRKAKKWKSGQQDFGCPES